MLGAAWFPRPMAGPPEEVRSRRSLDARRSFVASSNRREQMLSRLYGYGCHPNRDSRSSPGRDSPTRTADTIPARSSTLRRAILVQRPRQCSLVPLRCPFDRPVSFSRYVFVRSRPRLTGKSLIDRRGVAYDTRVKNSLPLNLPSSRFPLSLRNYRRVGLLIVSAVDAILRTLQFRCNA